MFIAALSGGILAISFIAQATDFGPESTAFALMILPVILSGSDDIRPDRRHRRG